METAESKILAATQKLQSYIEAENYHGYDPYDALLSPLFKLPFFKTNKLVRYVAQQAVKRLPFNVRPLLFIPKGYNPVTVGLCIQAYSNLLEINPDDESLKKKINFLIDEQEKLISKGFSGACWGYDFDWEARFSKIDAYQPTIVATGFITNALFKAYQITGNKKAFDMCESACNFILNDIHKTYDDKGNFCYAYSPFDKQVIFNAGMKGVRTLAQVYSVTKDEKLREAAASVTAFVMNYQQPNGSWVYSTNKGGGWVDNYHTGYIIDCLDDYMKYTGDNQYTSHLKKGMDYYVANFFEDNRIPKFYDKRTFPIDCTGAAQSLLTLCRFNEIKLATNVGEWMVDNMQHPKGYFYLQMHKYYTQKVSCMRWSNAWMFVGLTELLKYQKK